MARLALFDIDGTLMKESPLHTELFNYVCKAVYGVKVDAHSFPRHGMTDRGIIRGLLKGAGLPDDLIEQRMPEAVRLMEEKFSAAAKPEDYELFPGAREAVEALYNAGIVLGVVTGNVKGVATLRLERAGIAKYFSVGGYGDESYERHLLVKAAVARAKDMGRLIDKAFVVGDTPLDIQAALRAGAVPIGVTNGVYRREDLKEAALVIDDFSPSQRGALLSFIIAYNEK